METLTKKHINFLNKVCKGKWTQTNEGTVVEGYVDLYGMHLVRIPVKFYKVTRYFSCSCNNLISLEGCPEYVGGDFWCVSNNLTSLEGCPEYIGGNFVCSCNNLTSLKGCPKYIGGNFDCLYNKLTSLEGIGEVKGKIYCNDNKINLKKEKELRPEMYKKINDISLLTKMLLEF